MCVCVCVCCVYYISLFHYTLHIPELFSIHGFEAVSLICMSLAEFLCFNNYVAWSLPPVTHYYCELHSYALFLFFFVLVFFL